MKAHVCPDCGTVTMENIMPKVDDVSGNTTWWCTCFCSNKECEKELFNQQIIVGTPLEKRLRGEGADERLAQGRKLAKAQFKMIDDIEEEKKKSNKLVPKVFLGDGT